MKKPTEWGIDCDVLCYAVGFATQTNKDEDGNKLSSPVVTTSEELACRQIESTIHRIMEECGARTGHLYLTGNENYRELYALEDHPYKGHRKSDKPIHYHALKEHLLSLGAVVCEGCEADDLLAFGAYQHGHGIATIDKDLNMVAGWHYNWNKKKLYLVSPEEGIRFFYRQLITGDSADNIPGLFRLTGKKAMAKVLEPLNDFEKEWDMWEYVLDVFEEFGEGKRETWATTLTHTGTQLWMDIHGECVWRPPSERE